MAKATNAAATTENASNEIETYTGFTTEQLKNLTSFEDVEALFRERGEEIVSASEELGDGFALLDNKAILEDRPLMFVSWTFAKGDFAEEFVSIRVMCRMDNGTIGKYVINDGGTGIRKSLREWSNANQQRMGGMFVPKGLRKSEYSNEYSDHAVTWYVDTSA